MRKRIGWSDLLVILLSLVLAACGGSGGTSKAPGRTYTVTGIVTEADIAGGGTGGAPLQGVLVKLGSRSATTSRNGAFQMDNVAAGNATITFELSGYTPKTEGITVSGNSDVTVQLSPAGGRMHTTGATRANLDALNGSSIDATKVTLEGNVDDLQWPPAAGLALGKLSNSMQPLATPDTVTDLHVLVNGAVNVIAFAADGSFHQEVPVDPGTNVIQLRAYDASGNAYTTAIARVFVTIER